MSSAKLTHPIPPLFDGQSEVLILGSFPSVKSRESGFFYGHPQNRFWKVMAAVFDEPLPKDIPEKKAFLLRNHVALWDVIRSCTITGSSDASIRDAVVNDLTEILAEAPVRAIFVNGKTAEKIYLKYWEGLPVRHLTLPSTSSANAAWRLEQLTKAWRVAVKE